MPIITFNGHEAVRLRKANTASSWGNRSEINRVEPVAKPAFSVPFRLEPGEKIFTIGSCFARNVEAELRKRGFKVPMRDLFKTPAFEKLSPEIVNNFGTPSIYNELAWAFGEEPFDEGKGFVEVRPGQFIDLHMVPSIRPGPIEDVRARRAGLHEATRSLADCRVLIMTLGLVELWYDNVSGDYLNVAPLPSTLNAFPDRFSLHVLSFDDCYRYLHQAFDIAFKYGRKDLQVVLTVSPVPMTATHRDCDVLVANSYSKSVLRAVAEQICAEDQRISYFPSYESVTLSDRRIAWMDDLVHVTEYLIAFNVDRMVSAYSGEDGTELAPPDAVELPRESAEALIFADKARDARNRSDRAFFKKEAHRAKDSPGFAIEYARFLFDQGEFDEALAVIADDDSRSAIVLRGELLYALEDFAAVVETVRPLCKRGVKGNAQWRLRTNSAVRLGSVEEIEATRDAWIVADPRRETFILTQIGSALRRAGHQDLAFGHLSKAMGHTDAYAVTQLEMATLLLERGEIDRAEATIADIKPEIPAQENRLAALRKRIDAERAA
ncbi:GSCFA domain-containing protein [uncultured Parasphingopyxis sp.]|uniref:GSCFA domain-containing protein n=1 Tax=uncultured Parasphingopyxis sp. TaxID=1547918 RepID=UPI00261D4483|nr:GSCFA domain-containing protein [uncultured Parasphingopyxis sp.]